MNAGFWCVRSNTGCLNILWKWSCTTMHSLKIFNIAFLNILTLPLFNRQHYFPPAWWQWAVWRLLRAEAEWWVSNILSLKQGGAGPHPQQQIHWLLCQLQMILIRYESLEGIQLTCWVIERSKIWMASKIRTFCSCFQMFSITKFGHFVPI